MITESVYRSVAPVHWRCFVKYFHEVFCEKGMFR